MRYLLAISTLALALALTACGSGSHKTAKPASTVTPAPTKVGVNVGEVDDACRAATRKLGNLPDTPFDFNPDKPGARLKQIGKLLDSSDHDDYIEDGLRRQLKTFVLPVENQGSLERLSAAVGTIVHHETLRNRAALAGNESVYVTENHAAEKGYVALREAAKELDAPHCALGT